jgi:ElaB/YqjD/DUF883 family membrane-anchored ribosome-binding protein
MKLAMTTKPSSSSSSLLTPEERLSKSRSEMVHFMQKDNHILQVLSPVVSAYAKSNPLATLGIAAGIGAAVVVLKPWRLITLGTVLAVLRARL